MTLWRVFVVCLLIALARGFSIGDWTDVADEELPCPNEGLQCSSNCGIVYYCSKENSSAIVIQTCSAGSYCNATTGSCEVEGYCDKKPPNYPIKCTGNGPYPDAYDCRKNYLCGEGIDYPLAECQCKKEGEIYNLNSDKCEQEDETDNRCWKDDVKCGYPYESNQISNSSFYYVCITFKNYLVAVVFKRTSPSGLGEEFIGSRYNISTKTDGKCNDYTTPPDDTTTTTSTSPPTDEATPSATPTTSPSGNCTKPGELLPDDDECHCYWKCVENKPPEHEKCPNGTYFHCPILGAPDCGCTVGNCTDDVPTTPPACTENDVWPVEGHCHEYYRCNDNNEFLKKTCPNGTYFHCPTPGEPDCGCTVGDCND